MTTTSRRILLATLCLLGGVVGVWAMLLPESFYSDFPGFGFGAWVSEDGAFNEHLIRDVGELNLALAGAGAVAILARTPATATIAARVVAVGWLVYSIPHLLYHLEHLGGMPTMDAIGEPISLSLSILLSVPLLFRTRHGRDTVDPTPEEHA
jgi:hypothetical protein